MRFLGLFVGTCAALCAAAPLPAQPFSPEAAVRDQRTAVRSMPGRRPAMDCDYALRWGQDGSMFGSGLVPLAPSADGAWKAEDYPLIGKLEGKKLAVDASFAADGRLSVRLAWRRLSDGKLLGHDEASFAPKKPDGFRFARSFVSSEPAKILARNPDSASGALPVSRVEVRCRLIAPPR